MARFRRGILCFALSATLGLGVAACGDDEEAPEPSAPTTEAGAAPADAVEVAMVDTTFDPQDVEVAVGGTVTWTNEDDFAHTVTYEAGPGDEFDSGNVDGGGTYEQEFTEPGTVDYLCTIHPQQTGTVTVAGRIK